jgi:hypothetical protein
MTILNFNGEQATQMAVFTNRLPDINMGHGWVTAGSQGSARRALQQGTGATVRLRIGDRVCLEDILKQAIPVGTVLTDLISSIDPTTLSADQQAALTIFKDITA